MAKDSTRPFLLSPLQKSAKFSPGLSLWPFSPWSIFPKGGIRSRSPKMIFSGAGRWGEADEWDGEATNLKAQGWGQLWSGERLRAGPRSELRTGIARSMAFKQISPYFCPQSLLLMVSITKCICGHVPCKPRAPQHRVTLRHRLMDVGLTLDNGDTPMLVSVAPTMASIQIKNQVMVASWYDWALWLGFGSIKIFLRRGWR